MARFLLTLNPLFVIIEAYCLAVLKFGCFVTLVCGFREVWSRGGVFGWKIRMGLTDLVFIFFVYFTL